ncbi:MAG TPA: MFS transporter [Anaerolineales bacterium]|nr:MFS transporter [Anaerolineales bacterium]
MISEPKRLPRNVWVLALVSFLTDVSSEMISNLLPIFLSSVLGARTGVIGLIEGVAETTASLLKMVSGRVSDQLGKRKALVVLGYALSTAAKPLLYFANAWGWVLGVRFADRAGKGLRTAPRDALIADSVAARQRGLAFGVQRAGDTAGALVGISVALGILLFRSEGGGLDRPLFQTIVLWSFVPAAAAVLALALGAQERKPEDSKTVGAALTLTGLPRTFQLYLVIIGFFTLGNSSDAFLILRAQAAGLSVPGVLGMMICFNLVYAALAGPAGALSDRVGRRRLLVAGWAVYVLVYLGFALARSGWQAWVLMSVYGGYYALTEGVARAFVADLVPASLRGTAFGLFHAAVGLVTLPASLLAGILWQGVGPWRGLGPAAPFLAGGLLAGMAAILLMRLPVSRSD